AEDLETFSFLMTLLGRVTRASTSDACTASRGVA
ncbi:hypothetical protein L195_g062980, partial [Trifolium pratense]